MARNDVTTYQIQLQAALRTRFTPASVVKEWAAMRVEPGLYSPRLDLAVGPFATDRRCIDEYNELSRVHDEFLRSLFAIHSENLNATGEYQGRFNFDRTTTRNQNARCYLAIEIENMVSNKHLMGGAINASALGRIGLAVAWNENNLRKFLRMRSYLLFLSDVGKNSFDPANLLILTAQQLMDAATAYAEPHPAGLRRRLLGR